ncbi:hypothetical protein SK854_42555 [Lentzea sp. BCCO 10_0061]|uniref:ATP-grasp domain-containing protein n=1 Tax=Lentzea sokolovensis TaxID=3095429 RepID=A0ABU4VBL3_9PSEU|nr:hypothetical protein [Lentzea sp. BCCO 10_0061]MDX8148860.1 hypothetical protein [Lentzea sp. BCCO 10_0061]
MPENEQRFDRIGKLDIVVQNVASFRIDPASLARPDRSLVLICSPVKETMLRQRGRVDVFDEIVVTSDFTPEGLARTVGAIIEEHAGETRLLCHDEYVLGAVAAVREKLGIAGDRPVNVAPFTDKLAMKAALPGIRMPRHAAWDADAYAGNPDSYVAQVLGTVGLPAFVKPVNESGAVGAARIDTVDELRNWAASAGPWEFEIDEFVEGTLYHVDSAVRDGEVVHVHVNQDLHPCHEYADGKVNGSFTLPDDDPVAPVLQAFNDKVLATLENKPRDGVFHHEIFLDAAGEPIFLEIAARAPAALIPMTGRIRWGVDIEQALFTLQRGEPFTPPAHHRGPFAAYVYFPKKAGTVTALKRPEIASGHRWTWNLAVGDALTDATDIRDFAASVLLWNDDFAALRRDLELLDAATVFELA